jgi:hypothetical protein
MRLALAIVLLVLAGCSSKPAPLPVQPAGPTTATNLAKLDDGIDTRSNKVAASVTVIKENAARPEVVKAESEVALSFLPAPSESELALIRQRVAGNGDYAAAAKFGSKVLAQITEARTKMEADQREALRVSQLKDARIKQLEAEVETIKQEARRDIWTLTGAALAVIGAAATVFAGPRVGIPLLLCGAFCGSVPFIIDSPWFEYIAGATLVISCGLGLWWLTDKVRDSINEPNCPPPPSDEPPQA